MKTLNQFLSEGTNTPSVKATTNASGEPAWKAMNKHGKTKFFRYEAKDAAHRHAGIVSESADEKLKPGSFAHYNHHIDVAGAEKPDDEESQRAAEHSNAQLDKHYKVQGMSYDAHWTELDHGKTGSQQRAKTYKRFMSGRTAEAKKNYG